MTYWGFVPPEWIVNELVVKPDEGTPVFETKKKKEEVKRKNPYLAFTRYGDGFE